MPLRLLLRRLPLGALAVVIACAILPASALATSTPPTLSFTLSSAQAGGNPTLSAAIAFNPNSGDTPKDVTLQLAPGVLANAAAASSVPATAPATGTVDCLTETAINPSCQIGTDVIDGAINDQVYIVAPPSGVPGALAGLTTTALSLYDVPPAAVTLRTTPTVGLNLVFTDLPTNPAITTLSLSLDPTLGGQPFTHVPTDCAQLTNEMTVDYQSTTAGGTATTPTATDIPASFTPTGCPLSFTPSLTATAAATSVSGTDAVSVTGNVTFGSPLTSAATKDVTLTLPTTMSPNLTLVSDECAATDVTTCPTSDPSSIVGAAGADTAVLPTSDGLSGDVVLTKPASGIYPGLAIVIDKIGSATLPLSIAIPGSTDLLSSGAFQATFDGLPDIPLSSLSLSLSNTTLTTTCASATGELSAVFTDQNSSDPTVPVSTSLTITPCPTQVVSPPPPTVTAPTVQGTALSGLASGKPKLNFGLTAGTNAAELSSFTVSLPSGLSFNKKTFAKGVSVSGAKIKTIKLSHGQLAVTLKSAVKSLKVTLSAKALTVSSSLKTKIKKKQVKSLTATIVAKDTSGKSTSFKLKLTKLS